MRRIVAGMMAALMLLVGARAALAAPGDTMIEAERNWVESMVNYDQSVYLWIDQALYTYNVGDTQLNQVAALDKAAPDERPQDITGETCLIAGEDALYHLDTATGQLSRMTWADGRIALEAVAQFDWDEMTMAVDAYTFARRANGCVLTADALYLLRQRDNYLSYDLMRFNLSDGQAQTLSEEPLTGLCAYRDGEMLGITAQGLFLVDSQSGAMRKLSDVRGNEPGGLVYDAEKDEAYYLSRGQIYAGTPGQEFVRAAYSQDMGMSEVSGAALLPGGYYVHTAGNGIIVRNVDPAHRNDSVLKINGIYDPELLAAFSEANPEISAAAVNDYFETTDQLVQNMRAGEQASDLYIIGASELSALYGKDYVKDLSDSQAVQDFLGRVYPEVAAAVTRDGAPIAMPYALYASGLGYSLAAFEKVGLTQEDVPTTYAQMMDFIDRWQNEFADEYPEMTLFEKANEFDLKTDLLSRILHQHELSQRKAGQRVSYAEPVLLDLLSRMEQVDFYGFKQPEEQIEDGLTSTVVMVVGGDDRTPSALFTRYASPMAEQYGQENYQVMPLALHENTQALISAQLYVVVVNPESKNAEWAMEFLKMCSERMSAISKINLMPDENQPVRDARMLKMMQDVQVRVDELETAVAAADAQAVGALEEELEAQQSQLKMLEKYSWSASEKGIQSYRQMYPLLELNAGSVLAGGGEENLKETQMLFSRFAAGQMGADEFLKELDRKVNMMQMEGN